MSDKMLLWVFLVGIIALVNGDQSDLSKIYKRVTKTFSTGNERDALNELKETFFTDEEGKIICIE